MGGIGFLTLLLTIGQLSTEPIINFDSETPVEVQEACNKWGGEYDICPELLQAICYHESRYEADVKSGTCVGIMQINEPVHADRLIKLGITDIYDIDSNIHAGADLLAELFNNYSSDAGTVLGLYHGEKYAIQNGKKGIYSEYTKEILEKAYDLERLHGK